MGGGLRGIKGVVCTSSVVAESEEESRPQKNKPIFIKLKPAIKSTFMFMWLKPSTLNIREELILFKPVTKTYFPVFMVV